MFSIVTVVFISLLFKQHTVISKERADFQYEKNRLQDEVDSLQQTVNDLQQTPEFFFRQGVDLLNTGNLTGARSDFETVISKFPNNTLVEPAKRRIAEVDDALARAKEQQELENLMSGTEIDYRDLITELKVSGLPAGKRYNVDASVHSGFYAIGPVGGPSEYPVSLDFDNPEEGKEVVRQFGGTCNCRLVVSVEDGMFHIHRAKNCRN